jgi:hypothetical protein
VASALNQRGYLSRELEPDGDNPDLRIVDYNGRTAFVDVKTTYAKQKNWTLKIGALTTYFQLTLAGTPVYIVWADHPATVDVVFTLQRRIVGGPHRPTGNGSLTDWLLVEPGGEPFDKFFPPKRAA